MSLKSLLLSTALIVPGCSNAPQLHYSTVAEYDGTDQGAQAVLRQSMNGGQIFAVPRTTIFIVPTASVSGNNSSNSNMAASSTNANGGTHGQPAAAAPPRSKAKGSKGTKRGKSTPDKAQPSGGSAGSDTTAESASPSLTNPLGATLINGESWSAVPVPVADPQTMLSVSGTNNLFHTDNVGIGHPQNSDIVSKITMNSTDNTEQVLQTAITVATTVAPLILAAAAAPPPGAETPAAEPTAPTPLKPVMLRVPDDAVTVPTAITGLDGWKYTLEWSGSPAGAVPLSVFMGKVGASKVAIFPVPACIPATLTLFQQDSVATYTFSVTVGTPAWVRPTELPAVGTVTMGSVCGSSSVDQSPSNSQAIQGAVQALTKAASDIDNLLKKNNPSNPTVTDHSKPLAIAGKGSP